jgi:hypothetical protein
MGLIINDPLEHTNMGIRVAEVHIQKTPDDKFEVIGMVKIYGDKTARESNRDIFTEQSVNVISDGVPSSPYDLVYNELKKQYPDYTDSI